MANKLRGEVSLKAGDETYTIRLTTNALGEFEDVSRTRIGDLQENLKVISIQLVKSLLWAGLRGGGHKDITLLATGDVIDDAGGLVVVLECLSEALDLAYPTPEDEPENPKKAGRGGKVS